MAGGGSRTRGRSTRKRSLRKVVGAFTSSMSSSSTASSSTSSGANRSSSSAGTGSNNNKNNNNNDSNNNGSNSMSIVEKLQLLRGLGLDAVRESDLSLCLRQSGYNVELAAERLVTGRFVLSSASSSSSSQQRRQRQQQQRPPPAKKARTIPERAAAAAVAESPSPSSSSSSSRPGALASSSASASASTPGLVKTGRGRGTGSSTVASSSSTVVTPREATPRSRARVQDPSTIGNASRTTSTTTTTTNNKNNNTNQRWKLCHRWVGDAFNLSRNGSCDYRESFGIASAAGTGSAASVSSSRSSASAFAPRIRSTRGTDASLPRHLWILGPLLARDLVEVEASALMEERNLAIGAPLALGVTVWIADPDRFFGLFGEAEAEAQNHGTNNNSKSSYSRQLLASSRSAKGSSKTSKACRDCAFALLQWAQHGTHDLNGGGSGSGSGSGSSSHPPVGDSAAGSGSDNDRDDDNDDDDDSNADANANANANADDEESVPEWARGIVGTASGKAPTATATATTASAETPRGFRPGIELRPYQKEGLHWMMQREILRESEREGLLRLLRGLADRETESNETRNRNKKRNESSNEHNTTIGGSSESRSFSEPAIVCDCGPVRVDTVSVRAPPVVSAAEATGARPAAHHEHENEHGHGHVREHVREHPLWERRFLCNDSHTEARSFFVQESVRTARSEPPPPPIPCRGGILADSMGLGKTVQLLALIQSDKDRRSRSSSSISSNNEVEDSDEEEEKENPETNRSTLVVAPLSLLYQWQQEIETKTTLSLRVHYAGAGDTRSSSSTTTNKHKNFETADVVITTYGTLQAEFRSRNKASGNRHHQNQPQQENGSPSLSLTRQHWRRVILDECHTIKNHSTGVARACCSLRAERRWAVSGTIIQNSLEDVYGILRFLRHEPFSEHGFWKTCVTRVSASDFGIALDRVGSILGPILLRRTKDTRDEHGRAIVELPSVDSERVAVDFWPEERRFYEALYRRSFAIFEGFLRDGTASSSWLKIFSLLCRLRQTCSHVALTVRSRLDERNHSNLNTNTEWASASARPRRKAAREPTTTERTEASLAGRNPEDSIDQSFLEDLHRKFKSMQGSGRSPAPHGTRGTVEVERKDRGSDEDGNDEENPEERHHDAYAESVAAMLNQAVKSDSSELNEECPICLDNISTNDSAITPCLHIFCEGCLRGVLTHAEAQAQSTTTTTTTTPAPHACGSCPVCSKDIDRRKILRMTRSETTGKIRTAFLYPTEPPAPQVARSKPVRKRKDGDEDEDGHARHTLRTAIEGTSSSKLEAIRKELRKVWDKEPGSKVLIFSQFLGFLDLLETALGADRIPYGRLDGTLGPRDRARVLREFSEPPSPSIANSNRSSSSSSNSKKKIGSVLLISMKAGGVGLNLVAARSVFIVDPWWNAAVEDQCVDRIHRIGQSAKTIYVRKFYVTNSIEERILELQTRKKTVARAALGDKATATTTTTATPGGAGGKGIEMDLSSNRPSLEDFRLLFGARSESAPSPSAATSTAKATAIDPS